MGELLIYLVKANVLVALLYLGYLLLLRKLTYFNFNRYYLIAIPLIALLFPVVSADIMSVGEGAVKTPIGELKQVKVSYDQLVKTFDFPAEVGFWEVIKVNPWMAALLVIYGIGVMVALTRLIWVVVRIYQLKIRSEQLAQNGFTLVKVPFAMAPFSFMKYVFIHDEGLSNEDYQQILDHEKVHIREQHTIDLIYVQFLAAIFWFNPLIWLLIKSLKTTHEYIVDRKMIDRGYSLVEYQTLLLKQLISNNSHGLIPQYFNLSFIKKRITMMEIKRSGWIGKLKIVAVALSTLFVGLVVLQGNSLIEYQNGQITRDAVVLSMDGKEINSENGISFDRIKEVGFHNTIDYKLVTEVDPSEIVIEFTLVRGGIGGATQRFEDVLQDGTNDLKILFNMTERNDQIVVEVKGLPTDANYTRFQNIPIQ